MKLSLVSLSAPLSLLTFASLVFAPSPARAQDGTPFFTQPAPLDVPHAPAPSPSPVSAFPVPSAPSTEPPAPVDAPAPRFGERGEVVVTAAAGLGISSSEYDGSEAMSQSVDINPSFQYFVLQNVSVGLGFDFDASKSRGYSGDGSLFETKSTFVSAGPRLGFNLPLGDLLSFWPQASFGLHTRHTEESLVHGPPTPAAGPAATSSPATTQTGPWVELYAPLLLHPVPHLFLGFGPRVYHDFARGEGASDYGESTTLGAQLVLGGWWGGPAVAAPDAPGAPAAAEAGTPAPRLKHFGDRGQVVLFGSLALSGGATHLSGSDSSSSALGLDQSLEWFFIDHVSLGFGVSYFQRSSTSVARSGTKAEYSSSSFGAGVDVGVDAPLGEYLSWYPRAGVGFGGQNESANAVGQESKYDTTTAWLFADAPILAHVAPHFFVGLGPFLHHDLTNATATGYSNRSTTIGASTLVGGWL